MDKTYLWETNGVLALWTKEVPDKVRVYSVNVYCDISGTPYWDQNRPRKTDNVQTIKVIYAEDF